ncbi:hematopoietic progenitor cell antigen CD34 [Protopterus annectens]|uniref:hematopoietic progenitor cell antigen CD34 n=1 Tax=Protopterus annectens TaxID=7888 RepID=UPI001CF9BD10|nr:hematopoietic progenitor cell antigen CD34 [Protopterus annectens]
MLSAGSFKSIMLTFNFFLLICALNSVGSRAEDGITTTPISLSATMATATIASTEETSSSSTSEPTSTLSTEDPSLLSSSSASQERDGTSTTASAVTSQHTQITTDTTLKETVSSTQQDNTSPNTKMFSSSDSISNTGSEISTTESTEGTAGAKFKERSGISPEDLDNNKHESQDESSPAPTKKPEKSKTVLAALLTVGLLLAAMIIAGYFLSHKQKWSPKPKRLEETDQNCVENGSHGGKLVSVNTLEPEDQQDKSNLNGGAQENGNSEIRVTAMKNERSNKQADTEL